MLDANRTDAELLNSLSAKLQVIRDCVRGVAERYHPGLYLWGEGGTSKSYTVEDTLKKLGTPYKLTNSRITGKGLFTLLRDSPDVVHVLEDVETLSADRHAPGVLRSALWGQVGRGRMVTWQTGLLRDSFVFTGGIILVANCPLDDTPALRALKTRITCLQYHANNAEVAALMRDIARKGHTFGEHTLSPEDCLEVAAAIVERTARLHRSLDLRLLVNTFQDRLQWENDSSETHWLDLLESRMQERVVAPGIRAERKSKELEVLRRIKDLPTGEQLEVWKREVGKSTASFYRRLNEFKVADSQFSQSA